MRPTKRIYTLDIGEKYPWKVKAMTYPLIEYWAQKIGAEFVKITEPKFSLQGWPERYEKFQIYELAHKHPADWHIYLDCDALVHPDMIDPTAYLDKSMIAHNGNDVATNRWRINEWFLRDGRQISSCNWFMCASDWCLDVWHPSLVPFEECCKNIFPVLGEVHGGTQPGMLIDDYCMSNNIARFGLKFTTVTNLIKERVGIAAGNIWMWHAYNCPVEEKIFNMKNVLLGWGVCTREELAAILKEDPKDLTTPLNIPAAAKAAKIIDAGGACQ